MSTKISTVVVAASCVASLYFGELQKSFAQPSGKQTLDERELSQTVNVSNQSAHAMAPTVLVASKDRVHLAWMNASDGRFDVLYSEWSGGKWSAPINVGNKESSSIYPSLAVDSFGHSHLSWMGITAEQTFDVFHANWTGERWTNPINVSRNGGISQRPQIAVDTKGVAHIVWLDNQGSFQLLHSQRVDKEWSDPVNTKLVDWFVTNDPNFNWKPSIDANHVGGVHVAWVGIDLTVSATKQVRHSRWDGNVWSKPDNASRNNAWAPNIDTPSVAVDSRGNVHLVWQDRGNAWYSSYDGGKWSEVARLNPDDREAAEPSVSSSPSGQVSFTWFERVSQDETKIIYRQLLSGEWSKRIEISTATLDGHGCTSIVDSNGLVHIAWSDVRSDSFDIYHRRIVP